MTYDVSIWEQIRSVVRGRTAGLIEDINKEIATDGSLREFQGKQPVPWQLSEILVQRAETWLERLYAICIDAHQHESQTLSAEFDRAVWAFSIEPFIMGQRQSGSGDHRESMLLELLLCAVGSPPTQRRSLKVSQKDCCFAARNKVCQTWYDKLHRLPPRINEVVAALGRFNELQARAARMAAGLPPDPPPASPQQSATVPPASTQFSTAPTTSSVEYEPRLMHLVQQEIKTESLESPESDTPAQLNDSESATWDTIEIVFLSDERVQIRDGTNSETRNYAEFGFADGRNEKPNLAWTTLRALATKGLIRNSADVGMAWPKLEKQVQELRKVLRKHFGISCDPIPFVRGVGYKARFKISLSRSFHT